MFTFPYSFYYSLITYCIGSTFLGGKTFTGVTPCPFFSYKISAFSFTIYSILGCSAFGSIFSFLIFTPIYSYPCELCSSFLL